eukprot:1762935-Prymnesium_polylepis.1
MWRGSNSGRGTVTPSATVEGVSSNCGFDAEEAAAGSGADAASEPPPSPRAPLQAWLRADPVHPASTVPVESVEIVRGEVIAVGTVIPSAPAEGVSSNTGLGAGEAAAGSGVPRVDAASDPPALASGPASNVAEGGSYTPPRASTALVESVVIVLIPHISAGYTAGRQWTWRAW